MEYNGGGAKYDPEKLNAWKEKLRSSEAEITTRVACPQCGWKNPVCLMDIMYLVGISNGVTCSQLGKDCHSLTPTTNLFDLPPRPTSMPTATPPGLDIGGAHLSSASAGRSAWNIGASSASNPAPTPEGWRAAEQFPGVYAEQGFAEWAAGRREQANTGVQQTPMQNQPPQHENTQPGSLTGLSSLIQQLTQTLGQLQNTLTSSSNLPRASPTPPPPPPRSSPVPENKGFAHPSGATYTFQGTSSSAGVGLQGSPMPSASSTPTYPFGEHQESTATPPPPPTTGQGLGATPAAVKIESNAGLRDSIIQVGEKIHEDPDVQVIHMTDQEGTSFPHPWIQVRGRILKQFQSSPPTLAERLELKQMRTDGKFKDITFAFGKKITERVIPTFSGQGTAKDFAEWEAALLRYFYSQEIFNSAVRFVLAESTLVSNATRWWVSHRSLRPHRCAFLVTVPGID